MRGALLALALLTPSVPQTAATETGIDPASNPEVVRVDCSKSRGSAFKVGPHILLSVAHVTSAGGCTINGAPINVLQTSGDFSILYSSETADKLFAVDCGGFRHGHAYIAIGYARGLPFQTTVDVIDTGMAINGLELLWGVFTVIPGQSGGAIIDPETRRVVGTINAYDPMRGLSESVALKSTPVCRNIA